MAAEGDERPAVIEAPMMRGRWFEELPVGLRVRHAITRTITESDNIVFSTLSMNPQPLHVDFDYAARSEFGKPLVNSLLTLALVTGLSVPELTLGTIVANLGFSNVEFPAPVFHGDTIRVETDVVAARLSKSRPGQGIVTFEHRAYNQHGQLVAKAQRQGLMRTRPQD